MRKVVLYELMTLDGVAEEPGDWLFDVDAAVFDNLRRVIERQDAVLLGRGTFDYWVDYWPTSDVEPFAEFINGTDKYVFSGTSPSREWTNFTHVSAPAAEYVAELTARPGGDIGIHGSITLARSLLRAGLVNELRLVVAPTLASRGRRLFEEQDGLVALELIEHERTPSGALLLGYRIGSHPLTPADTAPADTA